MSWLARLQLSRGRLHLARDSIAVGVIKIGAGLAGVFASLVLARVLSTEDFGRYFFLLSVVTVVATVGLSGLDQSVVRLLSASPRRGRAGLWFTHVRLLVPLSIIAAIVVVPLLAHFGNQAVPAVLATAAGLWVFAAIWQIFAAESLRGGHRVVTAALFSGLRNNGLLSAVSLLFVVTVLWLLGRTTLQDVVLATLLVTFALALVGIIVAARAVSHRGWARPGKYSLVLAATIPLAGVTVLVTLRTEFDLWLLAATREPAEVGLYAAAKRLAPLVFLPKMVVNSALAPRINPRHRQGPGPLEDALRACALLALVPGVLVAVVLLLAPGWTLSVLFGEAYASAWPILSLLTLAQVVNLAAGPNTLTLNMLGAAGAVIRDLLVALVAFLTVVLLWASNYGGTGVAAAFLLSTLCFNLLQMWSVRRRFGVWTVPSFSTVRLQRGLSDTFEDTREIGEEHPSVDG